MAMLRAACRGFTSSEWRRLAAFYGFIAVLHGAGWGLYLHHGSSWPTLVGLGLAAYLLGLRHAFDADHIAAVDDTTRYLLQKGQRPLGVGFFFSLGHSTIVFLLAVGITFATAAFRPFLPDLQGTGGLIGASISGVFLWIIGLLNLVVLLGILQVARRSRKVGHSHDEFEQLPRGRGLMSRLLGGRFRKILTHSWQMYPLGLLFGLGFDTASEVGLLMLTAGASAGELPLGAVLSLPILFAAGMSAMDTTDGVLMSKAYHWALLAPQRRIFYNIVMTGFSIAVALFIGTVELLHVLAHVLDLRGGLFGWIRELDFGVLGYCIVGLFLTGSIVAAALWKFGGFATGLPSMIRGEDVQTTVDYRMGDVTTSHSHL